MKTMFLSKFDAWKEQEFAESKALGLADGKTMGKVEGKAEALIALLVGRFGVVSPTWRKRIREAKLVTLDRWFKRAIRAPDVRSVFNSPR